VVAINLFGVGSALASLAGALLYARHLERGERVFEVAGLELHFVETAAGFALYSLILIVIGILSALAIYLGEWFIARITVMYQHTLVTRILEVAADPLCAGWQLHFDESPKSAISRLAGIRTKLTAYAFRNMLRGILPIITFILSVWVLAYVDWRLTLAIVPIVAVWLIPLYLINRGVARLQKEYTRTSREARRTANAVYSGILESDDPPAGAQERARCAMDDPIHDRAAVMFWRRKLATRRVQAANTMLFVVCVIGLFLLFGLETAEGKRTWSEYIAYILALRFALSGIRQTTARFIKLSRYLPEYRAYTEFVDNAERIRAARTFASAEPLPDVLTLSLSGEKRWNSQRKIRLARGRVLWILTNEKPSVSVLGAYHAMIERAVRNGGAPTMPAVLAAGAIPAAPQKDMIIARAGVFVGDQTEALVRAALDSRFLVLVTRDARLPLDDAFVPVRPAACGVVVADGWRLLGSGDLRWLESNLLEIVEAIQPRAEVGDDLASELELEDDDDDDDED